MLPVTYDYVSWKALVGDTADNIKGVPRVGKKTADKILNKLDEWIEDNPDKAEIYHRNVSLIEFYDLSLDDLETWDTSADFDYVKERFAEMEFYSMISDKSWAKFIGTFEGLSDE